MATTPNIAALIERYFQEYADAAEIEKILVDPNVTIDQPNQLITVQYAMDHHAAAGSEGPRGPIGHIGPQGHVGADGPEGPAGSDGHDGAHGTGINLLSSLATVTDLPTTGNTIADAHMTRDDGHIHMWDGTQWVDGGKILGPVGSQGIRGLKGERGVHGIQGIPGKIGPDGPRGAPGHTQHQQFTDRNSLNSHPYTAISDIHRVFDDRLAGYNAQGTLDYVHARSLDCNTVPNKNIDGFYISTGLKNAPVGVSHGFFYQRVSSTKYAIQTIYAVHYDRMYTRTRYNTETAWSAWRGRNVTGGTGAPPANAADGDLYIQY